MKTRLSISPRYGLRAFTLTELMVAVAISSIFLAALATMSMYSARSFVAMGNYADLDRVSRNALDHMIRDVRQTKALTSFSETRLAFRDYDDTTLTFEYSPDTGLFTRTKNGDTRVLLQQCDYLHFSMYQRNPTNDFTFIEAQSVLTAKLIDVTWRCSRSIMGAKVNTESVQTAKIVVRN